MDENPEFDSERAKLLSAKTNFSEVVNLYYDQLQKRNIS